MPIFNNNGVNLNYEVSGQGRAIVCVHGYTGSSQDWAEQMSALSPNYRVVALDLRGHGRSEAPSNAEQYSVPIFADDVLALLRALDIDKCCLMVHSLGGLIALQFALEHADMISALVLVGTGSGERASWPPGFAELRRKLSELARSGGMQAAFEYDAANNPQRIETFQKHPEQREIVRQRMLATSVDGYIYVWRVLTKQQPMTSRLSEIKVPTLIYWGDEDTLMANSAQTLKKGIANSELITVKGVGHSPHYESPELFNEKLLEFLSRVGC
ncbi:alpha/beta fold hydrolase [Chloroflexota bacterium]